MTDSPKPNDPRNAQRRTIPGGAAALPPGTLSKPFFGPQGDENRTPPKGAPVGVPPEPVVDNQLPRAPK
jgi:hypothetical protein